MLDRAEINAELLTELAKVLLCDVKVEDILSGKLWFSRIPCQTLANYMMDSETFNHHYSATEDPTNRINISLLLPPVLKSGE